MKRQPDEVTAVAGPLCDAALALVPSAVANHDLDFDAIKPLSVESHCGRVTLLPPHTLRELQADWLPAAQTKLDEIAKLKTNWDGRQSPAPKPIAVLHAQEFLDSLHACSFPPRRISPSAMGGIGMTFRSAAGRRAYVEFRNSGNSYCVLSDNSEIDPLLEPLCLEGRSLPDAIDRIRLHVF